MKKTIYILLLLILFSQLGGMLIVLNIQQQLVRTQMKKKLESDTTLFEQIILTVDQYKKSKIKSDEIFLNDKMYDIKSAIIVGDTVKLLAINDTKEKKIIERINGFINNQDKTGKEILDPFKVLFSLKYIFPEKGFAFFNPSFQIKQFSTSIPEILSEIPDIILPPPRLI